MMKRSIPFVILVGIVVAIGYGFFLASATGTDEEETMLRISTGMSVSEIAELLHEENLIRSPLIFRLYARFQNADRSIRAGRFVLNKGMNVREVIDTITHPQTGELAVTFPEGFTIAEMDARLAELGLIESGEFSACATQCDSARPDYLSDGSLEGFLFPDTYFVSPASFSYAELIERMLENGELKLQPLRSEIEASERTISEIITMASIVEKEVRTASDYPVVAGILWARYDAGAGLGADATLLYGKQNRVITPRDLEEDSPYNTRKYRGLPPTPISNPGMRAIEATVRPIKTDYWFYLTKPDTGEVVYAKTNEEHNENKAKYLR